MICVDNSTSCRKAFEFLFRLVKPEDNIIFLSIGNYSRPLNAKPTDVETERIIKSETEQIITQFMLEAKQQGLTNDLHGIWDIGSPGELICLHAEKEKVDLIVVGARGLGLIKGLILGSVSSHVVSNAKANVLVAKY